MKRSISPSARGFTLLEVLAAGAVGVLLLLLLVTILDSSRKAWSLGERTTETAANARAALDILRKDLSHAVLTPDFGIVVEPGQTAPYRPQLKFLLLGADANNPGYGALKVCYQIAHASTSRTPGGLQTTFSETASSSRDVPVLVRTVSADLESVFQVSGPADRTGWAAQWPDLESPAAGDSTEIVAENVLGWSFAVFLRNPQGDLTLEPPENQAFYDSLSGIEALTLQLAILPAQILPRGQITAGFADVSTRGDLFASVVADDPTGLILREHRRIFSLDVSLRSRVP